MAWIALRYQGYEIYDDCDLLVITGTDEAGGESTFELSLDELGDYLA